MLINTRQSEYNPKHLSLSIYDGAHGGGGRLQKMDTCSTSFSRKRVTCQKFFSKTNMKQKKEETNVERHGGG